MGEVYRAFDTQLARSVALKRLLPGDERERPDWVARMLREARAAAAFNHPNAVAIYDVGEHDGLPFLVMELVDGQSLRAKVGATEPGWQTRVGWMIDVGRALGAAHAAGLVHRDVKPDNVMVRAADGVVKVLDFGIARSAGDPRRVDASADTALPSLGTITREGVSVGTPAYMSPEQIRSEALDGRSDQFAWGVMLFELLAGKLPWGDATDALPLVAAVLTGEVESLASARPGLPAELDAVVARATAKRAADRYASMNDAVTALAAAVDRAAAATDVGFVNAPTVTVDAAAAKAASSSVAVARTDAQPAPSARTRPRWAVAIVLGGAVAAASGVAWQRWARSTAPAAAKVAPASAAPAAAPPATSPSADPALWSAKVNAAARFPCVEGVKNDCSAGTTAWCDVNDKPIACCASDLVATGVDGVCDCPPGGGKTDAATACPPPAVADPTVQAGAVVQTLRPLIRACFNQALNQDPALAGGSMILEVQMAPDGTVYRVRVKEGRIPSAKLQLCVLGVLRGARFPPPPGGVSTLRFPVRFTKPDAQ